MPDYLKFIVGMALALAAGVLLQPYRPTGLVPNCLWCGFVNWENARQGTNSFDPNVRGDGDR